MFGESVDYGDVNIGYARPRVGMSRNYRQTIKELTTRVVVK